jgi:hypothetical protein
VFAKVGSGLARLIPLKAHTSSVRTSCAYVNPNAAGGRFGGSVPSLATILKAGLRRLFGNTRPNLLAERRLPASSHFRMLTVSAMRAGLILTTISLALRGAGSLIWAAHRRYGQSRDPL